MPLFGTVLTSAGEIIQKTADHIKTITGIPADWVFIGQVESMEEFVTKTNEIVITVTYVDSQEAGWQIGGGNFTNVRQGILTVIIYRRSDLDTAREIGQSINNVQTGINWYAETIYKVLSQWYPVNSSGDALTVQPYLGVGINREERQVNGYTRVNVSFHVMFLV